MRDKRLLFIFVQLLQQLKGSEALDSAKGWLRVCDHLSGKESVPFEVEAEECPHGTWLSTPTPSSCICLNGLWAMGGKWCDADYSVFLGQGHCFKMNAEVQKLSFLGNPLEPFAPLNWITKQNGHVFKAFNESISMPYEYENELGDRNLNKTLLTLAPTISHKYLLLQLSEEAFPLMYSSDYISSHSQLCVEIEKEDFAGEAPTLHLYKIRQAIKTLRLVDECPDQVPIRPMAQLKKQISMTKIQAGQGIHVKSGRIISEECESCTKTPMQRFKRSAQAKPKGLGMKKENIIGANEEDRQRLVNEETLRIIKTEVMFILDREKPPKHSDINWQLLQRAKEAFVKVCPEVEVPKFLVNSLLRLFRFLYIHSKDQNPFPHFFEEEPQSLRIAEALDACAKNAGPLNFKYAQEKVEGTCELKNVTLEDAGGGAAAPPPAGGNKTANATDGEEKPTSEMQMYCTCNDEIKLVSMNYTKNASNPNQLFNLTKEQIELPENYSYTLIPPSETFNGSYHDFPIETTWKIISFAHYYCAKYFKERPADHSAMLMKFETFFNSDVVYRWGHPGLTTNETWQNLYNNFNLQKFADSVDVCVASAKQVSDYPEWISRPNLESLRRRKRSLEAQPVSSTGSAYCLKDPWDPVNKLGVPVSDQCYEWNSVL